MPVMGARTHAVWLGSMVFDGARAFEGVTPDLDLHCARVNARPAVFAQASWSRPTTGSGSPREGVKRFDSDAELYIRPMYWAESGFARRRAPRSEVDPLVPVHLRSADAEAARRARSRCRRTAGRPRNARRRRQGRLPLSEQRPCGDRGPEPRFRQLPAARLLGNVAELGTANVFMAKDGVVFTPAPNGTFLNGITRQRVIKLLRDDGARWSRRL